MIGKRKNSKNSERPVEWDHISKGNQHTRLMWQLLAIATTMLSILSTGAAFHFAKSSQYIPYIVEVDTHGRVKFQGVPEKTRLRDPRMTRATVVDFLTYARMVTVDLTLQKKAFEYMQAHLSSSDPAASFLANYYEKASPYDRANKELVRFDLVSAIPNSENTWQVDWVEVVTDHRGNVLSSENMRASVTIYFADQSITELEHQLLNPTNMYIHDLSWIRTL